MRPEPAQEFNFALFHRRRKLIKMLGTGLVVVGLFTVVDMVSTIPIPLTGFRAIFVGTLLLLGGLYCLYQGFKLPVAEALLLIHRRPQGITVSELVHEMLVDRVTAERLLQELIRRGFVRSSVSPSDAVPAEELFEPVR